MDLDAPSLTPAQVIGHDLRRSRQHRHRKDKSEDNGMDIDTPSRINFINNSVDNNNNVLTEIGQSESCMF